MFNNSVFSDWRNLRASRRILSWKTEKGQDLSINRIVHLLERLHGDVLEIGPGSGNLLPYLPRDIRYTCVEPNAYLHEAIRQEAARCGLAAPTIISGTAERMALPAEAFDAVISVRSLCSMDASVVLQEVMRVLKPGGWLVFVEHVAAPEGSGRWLLQHLVRYPHKLLRGGCDPAKDTEALIRQAGFSNVTVDHFELDREIATARIAGVAVK